MNKGACKPTGMRHSIIGWTVPNTLTDHSAFAFMVKQSNLTAWPQRNQRTILLSNVSNYLPNYTASHPRSYNPLPQGLEKLKWCLVQERLETLKILKDLVKNIFVWTSAAHAGQWYPQFSAESFAVQQHHVWVPPSLNLTLKMEIL